MKKIISLLFVLFISLFLFSCSCNKDGDKKIITIIEYVSVTALDDAKQGIVEELANQGYVDGKNCTIKVLNPQAKADTLSLMVESAVSESDIIFAIATPVAIQVKSELERQGKSTPTFFTAVTDPVASNIMSDADHPDGSITGTSDLNPVDIQVQMLKEINPDAKKIGFIYTSSETNSIIQLNIAQSALEGSEIEIVPGACNSSSDLELVATELCGKVDAIYVPTDNEVSSQMSLLSRIASEHGIITICGEINEVKDGGTITRGSVDYLQLGKLTAQMAVKVLNGTDIKTIAVQHFRNEDIAVNATMVSKYNLNIPQSIIDQATIKY